MPRNLSRRPTSTHSARGCARWRSSASPSTGRDGVSMRQLADALGCSPMTPYRYFRNKDEILAAVRTAAFDRFAAALEEPPRKTRGDLRPRRPGDGRGLRPLRAERPRRLPLMFDLSQPHPERYPELVRASARARHDDERGARGAREGGHLRGRRAAPRARLLGHDARLVVLHLAGKLPTEPRLRDHPGARRCGCSWRARDRASPHRKARHEHPAEPLPLRGLLRPDAPGLADGRPGRRARRLGAAVSRDDPARRGVKILEIGSLVVFGALTAYTLLAAPRVDGGDGAARGGHGPARDRSGLARHRPAVHAPVRARAGAGAGLGPAGLLHHQSR